MGNTSRAADEKRLREREQKRQNIHNHIIACPYLQDIFCELPTGRYKLT